MRFIESSHSVYSLSSHIVWVTKYCRRILNSGVFDYLRKLFPKLIRSIPGVEIEEIGFDKDHIHFVMKIPPNIVFQMNGTNEKQICFGIEGTI